MEKPRSKQEYNGERDMERFWSAIAPRKEPFKQRWYLPLLLLFIVISVPWYYPPDHIGTIVGGLPLWVWIALASSVAVMILTAIAALRFWKDEGDREE